MSECVFVCLALAVDVRSCPLPSGACRWVRSCPLAVEELAVEEKGEEEEESSDKI